MKRALIFSLSCACAAVTATASQPLATPEPVAPPAKSAPNESHADQPNQDGNSVEDFRELARRAIVKGDNDSADVFFNRALTQPISPEAKRQTLIEYGHFLEETAGKTVKAVTVYEQILSLFPDTPETPDISLRLGRIQRNLGAFKSALNKFYNVLHATLRVKNGEEYQSLVLRAQFEIAETHFALGEYDAAGKFYSRLKLLDLPTDIRTDVHFKSAYILFLNKDYPGALTTAREYLKNFAGSPSAPEAQYLVIRSLKALNREEEALQETVKLLRAGQDHGKDHPQVWTYWQQKTGTELANELYGKGDYLNALTIYQRLAALSEEPGWRWPAVYQIALCFERLRHFDRAVEAFQFLAKAPEPKKPGMPKAGVPESPSVNLSTIREMAEWRLGQLKWLAETDRELAVLLGRKSSGPLENAGFMVKPDLRQDSPTATGAKPALQAAG